MKIKEGDKLPNSKVHIIDMGKEYEHKEISTSEILNEGKIILFGLPGAFTPGCSKKHLPSFLDSAEELKNKNILGNFTEKFFYFGLFSCIFLTFHALFLGLDIESKLFSQIRRLIIILFIVFEVIAQILLTKNLFTFKNELKEYISPLILKIKVLFVVIVFITTLVAFSILAFANPTTGFKHILEWNYFSFLLLYYLLSWLLWAGQKNQKF